MIPAFQANPPEKYCHLGDSSDYGCLSSGYSLPSSGYNL